jgi:hypothetical protein
MGLFSTPEEVALEQQQGQNSDALRYASLGADNAGAYLGFRGGQMLGGALSGPSPAVTRSMVMNQVIQDASDLEPGSDAQFLKIAKNLQKAGMFGDSLGVLSYAAQQGSVKAKTELEKAQAAEMQKRLSIFSGAGGTQQTTEPQQLSGPGADQQAPVQTDPYRNPALLRAASTFPGMAHLGAEADRLEKQAQLDKDLKQAQNPDTGIFTTLYEADPTVASSARRAQQALMDGNLSLANAQTLYKTLDAKDTAIRAAQAARSGSDVNVIPPSVAHLHGDDYLATLNPGMANVVKAIGDYAANAQQIASLRSGNREAMMQRVLQYKPDFQSTEYSARQKLVSDFKAGEESKKIVNQNQVIAHMGTLNKLAEDVKNGDSKDLNSLINNIANRTGNPAINNYDLAAQAVSEELMRTFRQVSSSEREAQDFERKLKSNLSPQQIGGALRTGAELVLGRVEATNNKWNIGMGTTTGFPGILSPDSRAVLDSLGVKKGAIPSASGGSPGALVYKGYAFPTQRALDAFRAAGG